MPSKLSAQTIANDLLTQTGNAMQSGDFDAFSACFSRPLVVETFEGKRLLQTQKDVEHVFQAVRDFRAAHAIVDVVRENVAAEFMDFETIAATHVSRMLQAGDILFGRPYPAYSVIKNFGGNWRIHYCQYAVDDPTQLNRALSGPEKTPRVPAAPVIK